MAKTTLGRARDKLQEERELVGKAASAVRIQAMFRKWRGRKSRQETRASDLGEVRVRLLIQYRVEADTGEIVARDYRVGSEQLLQASAGTNPDVCEMPLDLRLRTSADYIAAIQLWDGPTRCVESWALGDCRHLRFDRMACMFSMQVAQTSMSTSAVYVRMVITDGISVGRHILPKLTTRLVSPRRFSPRVLDRRFAVMHSGQVMDLVIEPSPSEYVASVQIWDGVSSCLESWGVDNWLSWQLNMVTGILVFTSATGRVSVTVKDGKQDRMRIVSLLGGQLDRTVLAHGQVYVGGTHPPPGSMLAVSRPPRMEPSTAGSPPYRELISEASPPASTRTRRFGVVYKGNPVYLVSHPTKPSIDWSQLQFLLFLGRFSDGLLPRMITAASLHRECRSPALEH